jgi:hypothetical protein
MVGLDPTLQGVDPRACPRARSRRSRRSCSKRAPVPRPRPPSSRARHRRSARPRAAPCAPARAAHRWPRFGPASGVSHQALPVADQTEVHQFPAPPSNVLFSVARTASWPRRGRRHV